MRYVLQKQTKMFDQNLYELQIKLTLNEYLIDYN